MSFLSWRNKSSIFLCLNFSVSVTFLQDVEYLIYKMNGWLFCQEWSSGGLHCRYEVCIYHSYVYRRAEMLQFSVR